jgi:hypothetical protein
MILIWSYMYLWHRHYISHFMPFGKIWGICNCQERGICGPGRVSRARSGCIGRPAAAVGLLPFRDVYSALTDFKFAPLKSFLAVIFLGVQTPNYHHYLSFSIIFYLYHYLTFSIIICHYESIIIYHYLSLSIIIYHYLSLSIIIYHYLSSSIIIIYHYHLSLSSIVIIFHYHISLSSIIIIYRYHLPLSYFIIIYHNHLSLSPTIIIYHYHLSLSSIIIIYHYHLSLPSIIIIFHYLSSPPSSTYFGSWSSGRSRLRTAHWAPSTASGDGSFAAQPI